MLINEALPEDLRDYSRKMDKKGVKALFQAVADKYPDKYKEISKSLSDIGHRSATESGVYSFGLSALRLPPKAKALRDQLSQKIDRIVTSKLPSEVKQKLIVSTIQAGTKEFEDTIYQEALEEKNPLAM